MPKRPSVLIVEARHNTRTFLEMTLNQEGMLVFSAVNLGSALLQLRVLQPDLIILRLDGPALQGGGTSLDGLTPGAAVEQIRRLSQAPLLALADGGDVEAWPGVAATLSYPFKAGQLCSKVAGLLHAL